MIPNGKKVRDNRVAVNLNHYEDQFFTASSELFGIDKAVLVRKLALQKAHEILIHDQPIAYVLPSQGTIQMPFNYSLVPPAQGMAQHA